MKLHDIEGNEDDVQSSRKLLNTDLLITLDSEADMTQSIYVNRRTTHLLNVLYRNR